MTALTLIGYHIYEWGTKIEVPDKERYERLEQKKKRKVQCASVDHEVDVAIADGGKADAICQTDDGWIVLQRFWIHSNNIVSLLHGIALFVLELSRFKS